MPAVTAQAGELSEPSVTEERRLEDVADRRQNVMRQIRQRVPGEPIADRLVSLSDPDATRRSTATRSAPWNAQGVTTVQRHVTPPGLPSGSPCG